MVGSRWRLNAVVERLAKLACKVPVDFSRIPAHPGRDLRRKQGRDDAILVGCPDGSIVPNERRTSALFTTESQRTIQQTLNEPFESDWHFIKPPAKLCGNTVNHLSCHHSFADRRPVGPFRSVLDEVQDGDRKVVIGSKQSAALGHNPVAIVVGIAGKCDIEAVFQSNESLHRVRR